MTRRMFLAGFFVITLLTTTFIAFNMFVLAPSLNAQESQPLPLPTSADTAIPEVLQAEVTAQAYHAAAEADRATRTIFEYRMAYVVNQEAVSQNDLLAVDQVAALSGAHIVSSWDNFVELNSAQPFDIVLLHSSMLDQVDRTWFQSAYRNGVIFAGINLNHAQMAQLTGDQCMGNTQMAFEEDFFTVFLYTVKAPSQDIREIVNKAELEDCSGDYGRLAGTNEIRVERGTTQYWIRNSEELNYLFDVLVDTTLAYGKPNPQ